jgi:hypothetical protein
MSVPAARRIEMPAWQWLAVDAPKPDTGAMPRDNPNQPFYLIVTDHDRGVFAVEGPMVDDRPWKEAARGSAAAHRVWPGWPRP